MATQVYAADLLVPAGTPATAPVSLIVPQSGGWVSKVTLRIPRGPNGLAGWALVLAGTVLIPYAGAGWVIGDDDEYVWQLDRWCNEGQLVVRGYNTGTYPHTFYFLAEWDANEPGLSVQASIAANNPVSDATAAVVASMAGYESAGDQLPDLDTVSL